MQLTNTSRRYFSLPQKTLILFILSTFHSLGSRGRLSRQSFLCWYFSPSKAQRQERPKEFSFQKSYLNPLGRTDNYTHLFNNHRTQRNADFDELNRIELVEVRILYRVLIATVNEYEACLSSPLVPRPSAPLDTAFRFHIFDGMI